MNQHGRVVPVDKHKDLQCSYIINPSGDCVTTQSTILPILVANNWTGHSGTPTLCDKDFSNLLKISNVFLFSGHGGGEKHWSGSSVQRLFPSSHGIALLMGCSSTKPYGDYDSCFATPFHYLIGGFRAVVGTLWDVLGRELDRMTVHIIQSLKSDNVRELVYILEEAKRLAKLSYLSSASVVVYVDESLFPN
jgi:separase